jgi:hypothetical protein
MIVVRYSNEVLRPPIINQKFDIPGTYMNPCVKDKRLDLLDFLPNKGFLADSKCLWTSVSIPKYCSMF